MKTSHKNDDARHPNILFILTDQQRPDTLSCYGNDIGIMPNVDRLGREGVYFNNCYVQNPLCCPSRYSILTGRYPHCHGVLANWYAPREGETSFGHQLTRVGYRTGMIGKMHLTPWHDRFGFGGRIIAESKFHFQIPDDYERFLKKHGKSRNELYDLESTEYIQNNTAVKSKLPQELHIDSFVGRATCEYLRHIEEPFCLFTSFLGPHNPYDPPEPYDTLYLNKSLQKRNMSPGEVQRKPREAYDYINNRLKRPYKTDEMTDEQIHIMKAYYYANCTLIDDWIGQMLSMLKERGLYENTVIVFTSDHGDLLGDHGLVYKQCFYEQSVKAPLIIHAPAFFSSGSSDAMVESMDLCNTFCDLGGAWPGEGRQGKSLLPLLRNADKSAHHREAAFSENYFGRMVRYQDYKMVYYPGKPYGELYDLAAAPAEQNNLWDQLEGSSIKTTLKDLLLDWSFTSDDTLPLPVRPDHHDLSPLHLGMVAGHTEECPYQEWRFDHMPELYETWEFPDTGILRE